MWTSSDFSRCSLPVPDVTISLIIITDGEGQIHWSRTNEKHARIRSVPELGTRRSKGNKGRPTRPPRWMERDGKRVECSWRERERERDVLTVWRTTVELTSEIIRRDETGRAH